MEIFSFRCETPGCDYAEEVSLGGFFSTPAGEDVAPYACRHCRSITSVMDRDTPACRHCGADDMAALSFTKPNPCPACGGVSFKKHELVLMLD
jgi:hypothetical protein